MTDFESFLRALARAGVEYIVIGGLAGRIHGAARLTEDIDIVYRRTSENAQKISDALAPFKPYPRGLPSGLPFRLDRATIVNGMNFTLETEAGDIDLLGEIAGGGRFEDLVSDSVEAELFGVSCLCLGLDKLIAVKRAAGRPKDFEAISELEAIREERRSMD